MKDRKRDIGRAAKHMLMTMPAQSGKADFSGVQCQVCITYCHIETLGDFQCGLY